MSPDPHPYPNLNPNLTLTATPTLTLPGCLDRSDVPTPSWLLRQQAEPEVVSARAAAAAREDEQAP